jgi:hypothetical protein
VAIWDAIISREKEEIFNQIELTMNVWGLVTSKCAITIYRPREREKRRK